MAVAQSNKSAITGNDGGSTINALFLIWRILVMLHLMALLLLMLV